MPVSFRFGFQGAHLMAQVTLPLLAALPLRSLFGSHRSHRWRLAAPMALVGSLLLLSPVAAVNEPVQTFFVPLDEDDVAATVLSLAMGFDPDGPGPVVPITSLSQIRDIESIVSIVTTADGTTVYYDHWEDGYDEPLSPSQSSTEVVTESADAGTVVSLRNTVRRSDRGEVLPGNQTYFYDGGDRIWADNPIAVTRVVWDSGAGRGAALAGAVEVYDTSRWGTEFVAPIGEDLASDSMFEKTAILLMAQRKTDLEVFQPDGTPSQSASLEAGESMLVEGVLVGSRVQASEPVQAYLLAGDTQPEGEWELRSFSLLPRGGWASSYLMPVGNTAVEEEFWVPLTETACEDNGLDPPPDANFAGPFSQPVSQTAVWLFNPSDEPLAIDFTDSLSVVPPTVLAAKSSIRFDMPQVGRGGRFSTAGGESFYALAVVNAMLNPAQGDRDLGVFRDALGFCDFSDGPKDNDTFDWGFALIPERFASTRAVVGWGPGNGNPDPTQDDQGQPLNANGNPIWVMPLGATTVLVDYDGDLSTTGDADERALLPFQSERFFDYVNLDNDQTGARIESLDPEVPLVIAWGEDPETAGGAQPYLDVGTAVFAIPELLATVNSDVLDVLNPGLADPGEIISFDVLVGNGSAVASLTGVGIETTVAAGTSYVSGSTSYVVVDVDGATRVRASSGPIPDNSSPATAFPLDEGGWSLAGNLFPGQRMTVTFRVAVATYDPRECAVPGGDFVTNASIWANDVVTQVVTGSAQRFTDCVIFEDDYESGDASRWSLTFGRESFFSDDFETGSLSLWDLLF